MNDEVVVLANRAVEAARASGLDLDYSPGSIEDVETLLNDLWKIGRPGPIGRLLVRKGRSDEDTVYLASVIGAYVGEVFRREFGGEWYLDTQFGTDGTVALRIGDRVVFPPAKVYKRLVNGPEDNVWFYYRVVCEEIRQASDSSALPE